MKIVENKVITDVVEMSAIYLTPSFEFDSKFGSINASFRMSNEEYEKSELKTVIDTALQVSLDEAKKKNPKFANQITSVPKAIEEVDDAGNPTGNIIIKIKNKAKFEHNGVLHDRKLKVVDSKGKDIPEYENLTAGTKARLSFNMVPYYMSASKSAGVTFWWQGMQVIEAKFYEGGSDFDAFDGGYVANDPVKASEAITNDELIDSLDELG